MEGRRGGPTGRTVFVLAAIEALGVIALAVVGASTTREDCRFRQVNRRIVRELRFTDLAFSNGTSYFRHPSQADLFAPHGDHPSAIEHFPAGSLVAPPAVRSSSPSSSSGPGP
jgi:hypothetical protein